MRCCKLSKAEMVNVQKRIAEKKQEGLQEFARENGVNV
jgi:hypothetical protein